MSTPPSTMRGPATGRRRTLRQGLRWMLSAGLLGTLGPALAQGTTTPAAAEASKAGTGSGTGYYVERRSYGTGRETEPPRYVRAFDQTWLGETQIGSIPWLDVGLDYRARQEYRHNDFRRGTETRDDPLLLRTRLYLAIRDRFDPLRATVEIEDARRNRSQFTREFDTRDVDTGEPIQAYLELHFEPEAFGRDARGSARPLSLKAGRMAFEYLDRRLLARNEWRNTTNTFQGLRSTLGQPSNDWQLDLLWLNPVTRFTDSLDKVDRGQRLAGLIGEWRRQSTIATLQPYYLRLTQDGDRVEYDANGQHLAASARIDRQIHTLGLRAYGIVGATGWDWDVNLVKQWGEQERRDAAGLFIADLDHRAHAYNLELGYTLSHPWKPRLSASYGLATGDKNPNDERNQRFERLFGFARPWSNNDYFQMENIRTPKLRVEFEPIRKLKIDAGYSHYRLDSATDRWNSANLRDSSGGSGRDVGDEIDLRVRFPVHAKAALNLGYAHFWGGAFTRQTSRLIEPDRAADSDFYYVELSISAF